MNNPEKEFGYHRYYYNSDEENDDPEEQNVTLEMESYNYEDFRVPKSLQLKVKDQSQSKKKKKPRTRDSDNHVLSNHHDPNSIDMNDIAINHTGFDENPYPVLSTTTASSKGKKQPEITPMMNQSNQSINAVSNMYRSMASNLEDLYSKPNKTERSFSQQSDMEIVENELYDAQK